jgi:hypothetical protein
MRGDEAGQKFYALLRGQIHDLDAAFTKPIDAAGEGDRLTTTTFGIPNGRTSPLQYQHGASVVTITVSR